MPLAGCRGFSANKWQCRGTGFLCSRATSSELQTLWRASYLSSQSSQVSMFNLQGERLGPPSETAAKTIQRYGLESSQAATPRTCRCHEGNSFSSCEFVGKCYRAPSASIGSAGSVWRRYERLWSFRGRFTMFTQKIGTAGERWNISERRNGYMWS